MPANKLRLNDDIVRRLPLAESGSYIVRDSDVRNFFVQVGKKKKTHYVQQDAKVAEKRRT